MYILAAQILIGYVYICEPRARLTPFSHTVPTRTHFFLQFASQAAPSPHWRPFSVVKCSFWAAPSSVCIGVVGSLKNLARVSSSNCQTLPLSPYGCAGARRSVRKVRQLIRETNDEVMGAARVADSLCNDAYDHAVCSSQVVCFVCNIYTCTYTY